MMSKSLFQHGFIRAARFGTLIALAMWPVSAWAQDNVNTEFKFLGEYEPEVRPGQPKLTIDDESTLTSKGCVKIATVRAWQRGTKSTAEVAKLLEEAVLKKAAEEGSDFVRLDKDASVEHVEVPTGKTKRTCTDFDDVFAGEKPVYTQHCYTDVHGFTHCDQQVSGYESVKGKHCKNWDETPITKTEEGVVSEGTIWRDPRFDSKLPAEHREKFMQAFKNRDLKTLEAMLKDDPTLAVRRDKDGWIPLQGAVGDKDLVTLFIAHGADVNAKGSWGWTPLHFATMEGNESTVELLLARGADVNARNDDGETPLFVVAAGGWSSRSKEELTAYRSQLLAVAALLIAHGADVNTKDKHGWTPMHVALQPHENLLYVDAKGREHNDKLKFKEMADFLRQHSGHE